VALLHFIYSKENIDEIRGSPSKVLAAIDEYGRTKKYLMNVGDDKGPTVCDLIADVKPQTMVELGGYVGYSCILFGDALRKTGGKRYISLEKSPEFAAVIMSLVDLAGLSDIVKVVTGASDVSLKRLHSEGVLDQIDLMFLDHLKSLYVTDLKLCEELKLIRPGSVLAADNVVKPGNPPYLKYVRSSPSEKREALKSNPFLQSDGSRRHANGETTSNKWELQSTLHTPGRGNPNLVYESKFVEGWEPSGVPVRPTLVLYMTKLIILYRTRWKYLVVLGRRKASPFTHALTMT
jgi:catechol O-methyltransferase